MKKRGLSKLSTFLSLPTQPVVSLKTGSLVQILRRERNLWKKTVSSTTFVKILLEGSHLILWATCSMCIPLNASEGEPGSSRRKEALIISHEFRWSLQE